MLEACTSNTQPDDETLNNYALLLLQTARCRGVQGASFRVVNGKAPTQESRFKHQLGFRPRESRHGGSMCGASLIRRDVAVTAAHCLPKVLDDAAVAGMRIYAGACGRGRALRL